MFNKAVFVAAFAAASFMIGGITAPAIAGDLHSWQVEVAKAVAKNQKYPRAALAREIEGRAKVRLVVAADGSITSHEVIEETGESVLDREIPKLVEKLNPLPALPDGQNELTFVLPLTWALQ